MTGPRDQRLARLPFRGTFGAVRPLELAALPLPPQAMPSHDGGRPLKAWRYVGAYSPEIMLCVGAVRVGRLRQSFWAVWDRSSRRLYQRTVIGRREVRLARGRVAVRAAEVEIDLALEESAGVETISPTGDSYAWTRKQGGVGATGAVTIGGVRHELEARAVIDDTAAYYARHTRWRWCAGVGRALDRRALAWNLVEGVHDGRAASERTVWIDGAPHEVGPCSFDSDLRGVDGLRFDAEAVRERHENLLVVRSDYRQPFGTFSGELPGGVTLADGYGVMEAHEAWW